jgi:hypothetical protein
MAKNNRRENKPRQHQMKVTKAPPNPPSNVTVQGTFVRAPLVPQASTSVVGGGVSAAAAAGELTTPQRLGSVKILHGIKTSSSGAVALEITALPKKRRGAVKARLIKKDKQQVLQYSNIIIIALQEALDYDRTRHHNEPTPALYINDPKYKRDIEELIVELRHLNDLLERKSSGAARTRSVGRLQKHFDKFLDAYSPMLGKGAAVLTIAAVAGLLSWAGVPLDVVGGIFGHIKGLK